MILLLYLNIVAFLKDFNLIFYYFFFQNFPLSQYCRDHQFWGVSKTRGGAGTWVGFFFLRILF